MFPTPRRRFHTFSVKQIPNETSVCGWVKCAVPGNPLLFHHIKPFFGLLKMTQGKRRFPRWLCMQVKSGFSLPATSIYLFFVCVCWRLLARGQMRKFSWMICQWYIRKLGKVGPLLQLKFASTERWSLTKACWKPLVENSNENTLFITLQTNMIA